LPSRTIPGLLLSSRPPQYVQISTLSPELQEVAVAHMARHFGKIGPVTTDGVIVRNEDMLRCSHPVSKVVKDENGIEYCAWCSKMG